MITLKNSMMTVDIDTNGAEIRRITVTERTDFGTETLQYGMAPHQCFSRCAEGCVTINLHTAERNIPSKSMGLQEK